MTEKVQPLISVIVPVYNVEKYIHKCIDSILSQSMSEFELLLIDDGSSDKSGLICDEYAAKDKRIKVFHKANGGVGSARQFGIEHASGEYTIHADPDDWMEPDALERMYGLAVSENADLIISDYYEDNQNESRLIKQKPTDAGSQTETIRDLLLGKLHGSCWNKLLRTSVYKTHDIRFIPGIDHGEDLAFWIQVLAKTSVRIACLDKAGYHYDISGSDSITRRNDDRLQKSHIILIDTIDPLLPDSRFKTEKGVFISARIQVLLAHQIPYEVFRRYAGKYRGYIMKDKDCSLANRMLFFLSGLLPRTAYHLMRLKITLKNR